MTIAFEPPKIPNGIVTKYKVIYSKSDQQPTEKIFWTKDILHKEKSLSIKLTDMLYYSNYSIELAACVDLACSEKSKPVYAFTSISCKYFKFYSINNMLFYFLFFYLV